MKLVEVNWSPTTRQLRQFGVVCLVALPLLAVIWSDSSRVLAWMTGIGAVLAVVGLAVPAALKPVFIGLMLVALPIGMVVSEVVMVLIYFAVFLPIGICFKLVGRDALKRSLDPSGSTYWEDKKAPSGASRYYRQW